MSGKTNAATIVLAKTEEHKKVMAVVTADRSKSSKIRELNTMGIDTSTIANLLTSHYYPKGDGEVRYQHVRNVLVTKLTGEKKK